MQESEYTINEIITAINSQPDAGWNYQDIPEYEYFFAGDMYEVKSSNIPMPQAEMLGKIVGSTFESDDGEYVAEFDGDVKDYQAVAVACQDGVLLILKKESVFYRRGKRVEGYWYSERQSYYPMPEPDKLTEKEAQEIFDLIKIKEAESERLMTRGASPSRIDKSFVGSDEYEHDSWIWPQGFAEHYVLKYKVRPTDDFLKFLGWLK